MQSCCLLGIREYVYLSINKITGSPGYGKPAGCFYLLSASSLDKGPVEKFTIILQQTPLKERSISVDSYVWGRNQDRRSKKGSPASFVMTEIKSATDKRKVKEVKTRSLLDVVRVLLAVTGGVLLLLLLVAGYRFYRLSPQFLYEQAFVDFRLSKEGDYLLGATQIEKAFREGDYKTVVQESKKKQPFTDLDYLLIGLTHLHRKDYSAAIEPLRLVNLWSQSDYKQEGEYYLALAYLRNKDYDKSLELMQRIRANVHHPYHEQITGQLVRNVRILKWR